MSIESALKDFAAGKFVIITDDESRENEGDLMLLAEKATTESIGFMVRYTSGVICATITEDIARTLQLPAMVKRNQDEKRTAFTVSIDLLEGQTTGISAEERANTIRHIADPKALAADFMRPGHIFPLVAHRDLFKSRQGHTEAGVVMAALVGAYPVTAISEIVNDDGSMARGESLQKFAQEHGIPIHTMKELQEYADAHPVALTQSRPSYNWANLPRESGDWSIATHIAAGGAEHAILRFGNPSNNPLIRLHSECLTGDALGSKRCDCGDQLQAAFAAIEATGSGYIIYLRDHEGRGIGLHQKIAAYILQDQGMDTVDANIALGHEADQRDWNDSIEIIKNLNISSLTLLSNNPIKSDALRGSGLTVNLQLIETPSTESNRDYLLTKKNRMSHTLEIK